MTDNKEIYISLDIEANGPSPGLYSMLSFGAVAFEIKDKNYLVLDTFYATLDVLDNSREYPETMEWWKKFPEMYQETRLNTEHPAIVMAKFDAWINKQAFLGKIIPVAYPATYDYKWIDYYLWLFVGRNRMGFACIDIKSFANAHLKHKHFASTSKRNMPKEWFDKDNPHTHNALDDAHEQAYLFYKMKYDNVYGTNNG